MEEESSPAIVDYIVWLLMSSVMIGWTVQMAVMNTSVLVSVRK